MLNIDWTSYGLAVLTRRRRRRLTQQALADLIGVSRNTISTIERGDTTPSYAIVVALCAALDVAEPDVTTTEGGDV